MKLRNGFVSNSSSSSFIVRTPEKFNDMIEALKSIGYYDYYIFNDTLYTSFISDGEDFYSEISNKSDDEIDGSHGGPYSEEDFIEVEGLLCGHSVWIPTQGLTKEQIKELDPTYYDIQEKLYQYVKANYDYISDDSIHQLQRFYRDCVEIIEMEEENED